MVKASVSRVRVAALILSCVGLAIAATSVQAAAPTGAAGSSASPMLGAYRETPSAALARHMRRLAASPRDFAALVAAGNAALELGDTQAAIGFFGRADEIFPSSPLPHVGMGAAMVADGNASAALAHFSRAQQLGASLLVMGKERGLAYDLLGRHSEAQADYRSAMLGSDGDEARRRLALSLAIGGKKDEALTLLAPLTARGDPAGARCRALVLAVSGDADNARRLLDARMPGSGAQMDSYFRRLPSLRSDQKAAAVHLGIFPEAGQPAYNYAASLPPPPPQPVRVAASSPRKAAAEPVTSRIDRVASIDDWLRQPASAEAAEAPKAAEVVRMASLAPATRQQVTAATRPDMLQRSEQGQSRGKEKVWLQLASGHNAAALPDQFRRLKTRHSDLLDGISGYVAEGGDRSRLLIGPFKSKSDAQVFADDLATVSVDAFSWTSPANASIRKLP